MVFSTNGAETTRQSQAKGKEGGMKWGGKDRGRKEGRSNTGISLFAKINSKYITDLNVRYKIIKFLEDNIEKNLDDDLSDSIVMTF